MVSFALSPVRHFSLISIIITVRYRYVAILSMYKFVLFVFSGWFNRWGGGVSGGGGCLPVLKIFYECTSLRPLPVVIIFFRPVTVHVT